jgi:CRISPR-associated protein Csd2
MATSPYLDVTRRHDFVLLFDVSDGNPNGDPDAGNAPRIDPETMQGLVTDVAIKRKVRDWVDLTAGNEQRNKIYVQSGIALNSQHERAYHDLNLKSTGAKQDPNDIALAREWMRANFYDIRMFGAVMTTRVNCGQVRGPIQLTFARSIDPIVQLDVSITRIAVTNPEDMAIKVDAEGQTSGKQSEMGRKMLVPYGLYRTHGFYNPSLAKSANGRPEAAVTEDDLARFWDALQHMWDLDRSASRGMMACRGLYVFSHESPYGNAPAHRLFERIQTPPSKAAAPRSFADYAVTVIDAPMPEGVALSALVS